MGRCLLSSIVFSIVLGCTSVATAGHRLIAAGDDWEKVLSKLAPGDEIVLMPGNHRGAVIEGVQGTGERPIVIRGFTKDQPAIIKAKREGLRLVGVRHVIVRDLVIEGATIYGISVSPPVAAPDAEPSNEPWPAYVQIQNVDINRTGPTGKRHAIQLKDISHARVSDCTIDGWGGAAIDITNSTRVEVTGCRMIGREDHGQQSAIHVRGGSDSVRITDCSMKDAGIYSIMIGGKADKRRTFPGITPPAVPEATPAPSFLATRVQVVRCVVEGSACPLHFLSASESTVRNTTFMRPRQWVFAIDMSAPEDTLRPSEKLTFGTNMVYWEPGDLDRLVRTGPRFTLPAITIEQNLWWSSETPEQRKTLGSLPVDPVFPQIMNVDPKPDKKLRPTSREALLVGAHAP